MKYRSLKEDCLCCKCFGCNAEELENFEGVYECNNFVSAKRTPQQYISDIKFILGIKEGEQQKIL